MDPMGSMSGLQFMMNYSLSVSKNAMETQEAIAEGILEMLPPPPSMGKYIDVYA